jgi:hypothetical protein
MKKLGVVPRDVLDSSELGEEAEEFAHTAQA